MKKLLFLATAAAVVLSSCSKDTTEVAPLDDNLMTISAGFESESTRTYIDGTNIFWSGGDAIGVFTETDKDLNVVFRLTAGEGTQSGTFSGTGSLFDFQNKKDVIGYYPYTYGATIASDELSGLSIPEVQLYNPEIATGSFNANSAPAVAIATDVEKAEDIEFTMKGVASYLVFPIRGMGNVEKLELSIENEALAGAGSVTLKDANGYIKEPYLVLDDPTPNSITLKMGSNDKVNAIHFSGRKNVVFVVPADINLLDNKITLTATLKDVATPSVQSVNILNMPDEYAEGYKSIEPHSVYRIYANMDYTELKAGAKEDWTFGADGQWVVDDQIEFITYAYMTQANQQAKLDDFDAEWNETTNPWSDTALAETYPYAPKAADYTTLQKNGYNAFVPALIVKDLDFQDWNTAKANEEYEALIVKRARLMENSDDEASMEEAAQLSVKINALKWYYHNGGAINSLTYNTVAGYGAEGAAVTISNLKVMGNGFTGGANLNNLVLENINVVADEAADFAGVVAAQNVTAQSGGREGATTYITLEDVTVKNGSVTANGATTIVGGIFGKFNPKFAKVEEVEALPSVDAENWGQVYGTVSLSAGNSAEINLPELMVQGLGHVAIYNATGVTAETTLKVTSNITSDEDYAGVVGEVSMVSVFVDGTAYWNGTTTAADADPDTISAEEFAYKVASNTTVELTNDINLQGKPWGVKDTNTRFTVTSDKDTSVTPHKQNTWTISEVNIKNEAAESDKYYSVFGALADISYVNVKDVAINLTAGAGDPNLYVSGLVLQGTVKNVAVEDIDITVNKLWNTVSNTITSAPTFAYKAGGLNAIGGVIAGGPYNCVENVSVKNVNILGDAYLDTTAESINGTELITNIGAIAGVLSYDAGKNKTIFTNLDVQGAEVSVSKPMTNAKAKKSESYNKDCVYSFNDTAVGVIWMYNADFTPGVNATHYLVANGCETSGDRFTAGILAHNFVNYDSTPNNVDVVISENEITDYAYMIYAPSVNNSTKAYIGFKPTN